MALGEFYCFLRCGLHRDVDGHLRGEIVEKMHQFLASGALKYLYVPRFALLAGTDGKDGSLEVRDGVCDFCKLRLDHAFLRIRHFPSPPFIASPETA